MNRDRFEIHSHTVFSNFRLLDCINKISDLVDKAIEYNLKGIAITDHETVAGHVEANLYQKKVQEKYPDFKVALGNEIYLCADRSCGQRYYHFILIAKNKQGQRALRELSSRALLNSYWDRGMERAVTTYKDIEEIMARFPGTVIASTACLGGQLSVAALKLITSEQIGDIEGAKEAHNEIVNFVLWCKKVFGEDFYCECAPGCSREQVLVNKRLRSIAKAFNLKMVVGSDAHYLDKEDRYAHKAYLTSKSGEREVDDFYEYAYFQTNDEIVKHLRESSFEDDFIYEMFDNSVEIWSKIENYSLEHKQTIPKVKVNNYGIKNDYVDKEYPILNKLFASDSAQERYWVNECYNSLLSKENSGMIDIKLHGVYMQRLEKEADIIDYVGKQLEDCLFAYFNTFQHYIDLFWECGSIVGPGRGSSTGFLSNFLMGLTQLDPIKWNLYEWRFLSKHKVSLPKQYWADVKKERELRQEVSVIKQANGIREIRLMLELSD